MIQRVRGTQDILDTRSLSALLSLVREHIKIYGFNEIELPLIEQTQLFKRSVGEHTDIVSKEMYTFSTGLEEEELCLRPEATASVMRAFLENNITKLPWKTFLYGPMFRRERPQKGRWRQFSQLNFEIIGTQEVEQYAFFVSMFHHLFKKIIPPHSYELEINWLGSLEDRKEHKKALKIFVEEQKENICATCISRSEKNLLRIYDCKNEKCQHIYLKAPALDQFFCSLSRHRWEQFTSFLNGLQIPYVHKKNLVRGLDYYHDLVFEWTSPSLGAQSTFAAGGSWELASLMGHHTKVPSLGAAIGVGRLLMISEQALEIPPHLSPLGVLPFDITCVPTALSLADTLAKAGHATELFSPASSIGKILSKAHSRGVSTVFIIGSQEVETGKVTYKNMNTGLSVSIEQTNILSFLAQNLDKI